MMFGGVHSSQSSGNLVYNQHDMSTSPRLRTHKCPDAITLQQASSSSYPSLKRNSHNSVIQQCLIALHNAKSTGNIVLQNCVGLQMPKLSGNILLNRGPATSPPRVHFRGDSIDTSDLSGKTTNFNLQRSQSLGAADVGHLIPDMGPMPADVHAAMLKAVENPNQLPTRALMELVRTIFIRASESARYAEPAANFCIIVIEKEKKGTFLESLLNDSLEWFTERDHLLKQSGRWAAYVSFMYEMYCQLKRHPIQMATQQYGAPPGLQMLSLLEQCCQVYLKPPSVHSLSEIKCLFFILTFIGRDLELELPGRLQQLMAAVRDAFLFQSPPSANKKTLLQLIELHAAKWKLPATTDRYYHPGAA